MLAIVLAEPDLFTRPPGDTTMDCFSCLSGVRLVQVIGIRRFVHELLVEQWFSLGSGSGPLVSDTDLTPPGFCPA